ncbi:hypothetical protein KF913_18705 [Candidatus Obscuribacterales bacterium]|nr:hypothetical protein [Candidatus Obscuribacterales bacterium]
MRVSVKAALLIGFLAGMATIGEYNLLNAAHASTGHTAVKPKTQIAFVHKTVTKQIPTTIRDDDYDSYVDSLNAIEQDPEHAQAKMITASYDINN